MSVKLPFLQESHWPSSKEPEERVVNPSYDKQLQDHLLDELLVALEQKHSGKLRECLTALVHAIRNEEVPE